MAAAALEAGIKTNSGYSGWRGHMSCVTCHVSPVTCHLSHVTCHLSHVKLFHFNIFCLKKNIIIKKKKLDTVVELVGGGSVFNKPTPSSFCCVKYFNKCHDTCV